MARVPQTSKADPAKGQGQRFVTTRWTDLILAGGGDSAQARDALERLCCTYWYPLYAYLRRAGHDADDAQDVTQSFFHHLLRRNFLGAVDRRKGRFRSFLLASLNHFVANERDFQTAAKRGGGRPLVSLDEQAAEERYQLEPASELTPDKIFESRWAETVLQQARVRLQDEYASAGKLPLFDRLQSYLDSDAAPREYVRVAADLRMTAGSVAVTVHRLRHRFGELLRDEVASTVADPQEVDRELRHLCAVLGTTPR